MVALAQYNHGNALYRQAGEIFKSRPDDPLLLLQHAAGAYSTALKWNPDFRQAQYNLDATRDFARSLKVKPAPTLPHTDTESPEQVLASE